MCVFLSVLAHYVKVFFFVLGLSDTINGAKANSCTSI